MKVEQMFSVPVGVEDKDILVPIVDIFSSIQGEGAFMGMPCTFIRFAGCNLACPWCDTKTTWKQPDVNKDLQRVIEHSAIDTPENLMAHVDTLDIYDLDTDYAFKILGYRWLKLSDVADAVERHLVVFTGGEPMIYREAIDKLIPMIKGLDCNALCCCETNGTLPTSELLDWVTCSPKEQNNYDINSECMYSELKYVVTEDFNPDQYVPEDCKKVCGQVWLQPCDLGTKESIQKSWKRCYDLAMTFDYLRVGLQMHKMLGVE